MAINQVLMSIKPQSTREIVYTGVASLLPVIGQIIIATRPTLSVGAKVRSSLYAFLLTFIWLMLIPVDDSVKQAESAATVEDAPVADVETVEDLPSFAQMASCGNVSGDADLIYPVFLDNVDLSKARLQFCGDAISSVRQGTGQKTVILASFSTLKEAQEFADKVDGEVGEPDIVAKNAEPSREIVEEREQPIVETKALTPEVPLTPAETLKNRVISNTPGLFAQERISLLDADVLYNDFMPVLCSLSKDSSIALSYTKEVASDMAQRTLQADEKMAKNMAEGFVQASLEPGGCGAASVD